MVIRLRQSFFDAYRASASRNCGIPPAGPYLVSPRSKASVMDPLTTSGGAKSGSPTSMWTICLPCASSDFALMNMSMCVDIPVDCTLTDSLSRKLRNLAPRDSLIPSSRHRDRTSSRSSSSRPPVCNALAHVLLEPAYLQGKIGSGLEEPDHLQRDLVHPAPQLIYLRHATKTGPMNPPRRAWSARTSATTESTTGGARGTTHGSCRPLDAEHRILA